MEKLLYLSQTNSACCVALTAGKQKTRATFKGKVYPKILYPSWPKLLGRQNAKILPVAVIVERHRIFLLYINRTDYSLILLLLLLILLVLLLLLLLLLILSSLLSASCIQFSQLPILIYAISIMTSFLCPIFCSCLESFDLYRSIESFIIPLTLVRSFLLNIQ